MIGIRREGWTERTDERMERERERESERTRNKQTVNIQSISSITEHTNSGQTTREINRKKKHLFFSRRRIDQPTRSQRLTNRRDRLIRYSRSATATRVIREEKRCDRRKRHGVRQKLCRDESGSGVGRADMIQRIQKNSNRLWKRCSSRGRGWSSV